MADTSATSPSSSSLSDLTLTVRIDGVPEQEVFLQHGLSLGRNPSNTICVNEPDIERIHAMVSRQADGTMLLECTDPQLHLTMADGSQVHDISLKPGTTFKLGKAVIRCLKRETKPTVLVSDNPWDVRCPRCHETIADLRKDAKKCPKCKLELQYFQSHSGDTAATGKPQAVEVAAFQGWLPRQVGPYTIRAFVAQGGMGIILRGLHQESDRPAAVKLLKVDSEEDPSWKARFVAEIDTLKTLRHPNVVHLQDHGKDEKLLWLAMDWIDGEPLNKLALRYRGSSKEIPIDEIRAIILQVVAGLEYLHGKQIVHRDLKPSNVLMALDAAVKLVDFGIARAASGQTAVMTQLTHTGMVAGTESYMSPEQAEGQNITPASDIYSLGVMWYELVTGRRPIGAFLAPNLVRSDCPPQWSHLIAQCLQMNPTSRPTLAMLTQALTSKAAVPPPLPPGVGMPGGMTGMHPAGGMHTGMHPATSMPAAQQGPVRAPPPIPGMNPAASTGAAARSGFAPAAPAGPGFAPTPPRPGISAPGGMPQVAPLQGNTSPANVPQASYVVLPQTGVNPQGMPPQTGPSQAKVVAAQAGQALASAAKSASDAVGVFLQKNPPSQWLDKSGSAGAWVKSHKGPSIAIAAGAALIFIVVVLRLSMGGSKPAPTPANTNTANGNGTNVVAPDPKVAANNNPTPTPAPVNPTPARHNPLTQSPEAEYIQGSILINQATGPNDPKVNQSIGLLTDSANHGNSDAMLLLAQIYAQLNNRNQAILWARKARDSGNPNAQQFLFGLGAN